MTDAAVGAEAPITTGVSGRTWRASITPWGALRPWPARARETFDDRPLDWYVAAEDRWHVPSAEPTVRQRRVEGTAVTETRVRVPTGDVVQTIASVADGPGYTLIEIVNDSTKAVAIAFSRGGLCGDRPPADVLIEGLAGDGVHLDHDAFVVPVGHRSAVRVALAHDGSVVHTLPALPTGEQVARGWATLTDRASRFTLPPGELGEGAATAVRSVRCELALGGLAHAADDPAAFAVGLGELVRMGERPEAWLPELVEAVAALGPEPGWFADAALDAAARVLRAAGEQRAERDLARIVARRAERADRPTLPVEGGGPVGVGIVPWLEQRLADRGAILADGVPLGWLGANFEAHGVPVSPSSSLSFAVRWHGERPAVLWELTGDDAVTLTSPSIDPAWHSTERTGEALWAAPVVPGLPDGDVSFG